MKNWEEEHPVYEEELTPQQQEQTVKEIKERREREYERGRKVFIGMLISYVVLGLLPILFCMFMFSNASQLGAYLLILIMNIAASGMVVYDLYHGRRWVRTRLGVSLVCAIVVQIWIILSLDIGRVDYDDPLASQIRYVYSDGQWKESRELSAAERAELQKDEDARVRRHRLLAGIGIFYIVVWAGYFYILFVYKPVREFLYGQMTE